MTAKKQQTALVPDSPTVQPRDDGKDSWLLTLGLDPKSTLTPAFFKPESDPQRVTIMSVKGYGNDGIKTKYADGTEVKRYADVMVLTEAGRSMLWNVDSKPALLYLVHAMKQEGPDFATKLVVDVWTTGRGTAKEFHVKRISPEDLAREKAAQEAIAREKAERKKPVAVAGETSEDGTNAPQVRAPGGSLTSVDEGASEDVPAQSAAGV